MRNILKRAVRKVVKPKLPYKYAGEQVLHQVVNHALERYGREYCLDVGCGEAASQYCQTLDILPKFQIKGSSGKITKTIVPDYVGDVRQLFAPGYKEELKGDSSLLELPDNYYKVILLHHVLEHTEWIYTDFFLRWVFDSLSDGGLVSIEMPNAEVVARVYLDNLDRIRSGKEPLYPIHEHPYCIDGISWHITKWFDFKCFSGCSPGDYHHAMYDSYALGCMLADQGFERISIFDGMVIKCVAYKPIIGNGREADRAVADVMRED